MNTTPQAIISEEDQQAFNNLAANFAENELADFIHEHEYPYSLDPSGILRKIIDLGFLSINIPAEHSGLGIASQAMAGILEQISLVDAGMAGAIFANTAALEIISAASSSSSCDGLYEIINKAKAFPLAFQAYSVPAEASVPASKKKEGNYLLYGRADLLVSGGTASCAVIPARSDGGSLSYFLVNLGDKEIKKSRPVVTIGMQACRPVDLELNGARGTLIGKEGSGDLLFEEVCQRMSYPACGIFLGIMKGSFNTALEYCGQRYQGGRMIIQWDNMRMKLAGMASLIAVAETSVCGLKNMFAAGSANAGPSAIAAAIHIGNMAAAVTSDGI